LFAVTESPTAVEKTVRRNNPVVDFEIGKHAILWKSVFIWSMKSVKEKCIIMLCCCLLQLQHQAMQPVIRVTWASAALLGGHQVGYALCRVLCLQYHTACPLVCNYLYC